MAKSRQQRDLRAPAVDKPSPTPVSPARPHLEELGSRVGVLDRLKTAAAGRKVRTPEKALAAIEKLETEGVEELGDPVFVWPAPRGRVTGFAVGCEAHGVMPFLAPNRRAGHLAAARHVVNAHDRKGTIVLRTSPPRLRIRAET